jgi:hypothetical protein
MATPGQDRVEHRLAAIRADVVGYSRLARADEAGTARELRNIAQRSIPSSPPVAAGSLRPRVTAGCWNFLHGGRGRVPIAQLSEFWGIVIGGCDV